MRPLYMGTGKVLEIPNNSRSINVNIQLGIVSETGFAKNQLFVLECKEAVLATSMTYTANGRNPLSVTDSRGNTIRYEYDGKERMLKRTIDASGNTTEYEYDNNTDQMLQIIKTINGEKQVLVEYAYDKDRLKSTKHNGFLYEQIYDAFGNETIIRVAGCDQQRISYHAHNGLVDMITYADGTKMQNVYDQDEQIVEQNIILQDGTTQKLYSAEYDNYGNMEEYQDHCNSISYHYQYDLIGRLLGIETSNGFVNRVSYDNKNRLSSLIYKVKGVGNKIEIVYGDVDMQELPGLSYCVSINNERKLEYAYDGLARINRVKTNLSDAKSIEREYEFEAGKGLGHTTCLPACVRDNGHAIWYTYDANGNIKKISEEVDNIQQLMAAYYYDELNQLIRENNKWEDKTILYAYDMYGNILERTAYAYTENPIASDSGVIQRDVYTYREDGWKDQLLAYNNETISYNSMGNPLNYRGMSMEWENGKQLAKVTKPLLNMEFHYDIDGNRVSKKINDRIIAYYLNKNMILAQEDTNGERLDFLYDDNGNVFAFQYKDKYYYYQRNIQKDVIGILNSEGMQVVTYKYNSWGKVLNIAGTAADTLGIINPFRYRGYYYDQETQLYYLQSRYYDPETGRFVNADQYVSTEQGTLGNNMYTYAQNDPINKEDPSGQIVQCIILGAFIGTVLGAAISGGMSAAEASIEGKDPREAFKNGLISGAIVGGITGALVPLGLSVTGSIFIGAATSAGINIAMQSIQNKNGKIDWDEVVIAGVKGSVTGGLGAVGSGCFTAAESLLVLATGGTVTSLGVETVSLGVKAVVQNVASNKAKTKNKTSNSRFKTQRYNLPQISIRKIRRPVNRVRIPVIIYRRRPFKSASYFFLKMSWRFM